MSYVGKVRVFIHKLEEESNDYELGEHQVFDDSLISYVKIDERSELLKEEIKNITFNIFKESIQESLSNYKAGDVIELVADAHFEYTSSDTVNGIEHDFYAWFEYEKHRKLTKSQIKRFAPELG